MNLYENMLYHFDCHDGRIEYHTSSLSPKAKRLLKETRKKRVACDKVFNAYTKVMEDNFGLTYSQMEDAVYAEIGIIGWFFIKWIAYAILQYLWQQDDSI